MAFIAAADHGRCERDVRAVGPQGQRPARNISGIIKTEFPHTGHPDEPSARRGVGTGMKRRITCVDKGPVVCGQERRRTASEARTCRCNPRYRQSFKSPLWAASMRERRADRRAIKSRRDLRLQRPDYQSRRAPDPWQDAPVVFLTCPRIGVGLRPAQIVRWSKNACRHKPATDRHPIRHYTCRAIAAPELCRSQQSRAAAPGNPARCPPRR
jgi:hypothetical protein